MSQPAIQAEGLGKKYVLGTSGARHDTLRDLIASRYRAIIDRGARTERSRPEFWALRDAGFRIDRGESVGIIGLNGAGKSTLLKILSRIVEPTTGTARVAGRVGALLEVGTGFHSELTGRENTYLYGAILGMTKAEIDRKFDAIVEFSGVRQFIDTPVKRYSSGMYVRLAFAVAAHLEPEILLVDEVLSVGDLPFQRKCMDFAKSLLERQATVLFVSHNMFSIKTMCPRVIYLRKGQVAFDGPTDEGIALYEEDCRLGALSWVSGKSDDWPVVVKEVETLDANGERKSVFDHGEPMRIRLKYDARRPMHDPNFIIAFIRSDGVACCNFSTELDGLNLRMVEPSGALELVTPPLRLVAEMYKIEVIVREKGLQEAVCAQIGGTFHVRDALLDTHFGVFHETGMWKALPVQAGAAAG